jgi:ADP-heptose:LPS heptosyltransferase
MESVLERLPRGARVVVIRLRSLGDCVLTTPALRILKSHRPDLDVDVVVESRFAPIFEGTPDVCGTLPPSIAAVRARRAALCLNLHGGSRSIGLTVGSGARYRAGFAHYRAQFAYNVRIPRAQEILNVNRTVHTAEHLASAMFYLGARVCEIPGARLAAADAARSRAYAVMHPFASAPEKTWPADRFLAVAREFRQHGELEPLILCGPGDDPSAFAEFETVVNAPLSQVISIISSASLFVGNDSGPAHIAAAFSVPAVVLFGASDPLIWGPWRTASQVLSARPIESIAPSQVLDAIDRLKVRA